MQIIDQSIFRAYDIRGIACVTLTEETVMLIGKAIGSLALEQNVNQIVIARDGRFSGPLLSRALSSGILATGCHVTDLGMVPTPLLYYAATVSRGHSGVMLTGSHNPPEYNGLKMIINGKTLTEDAIKALYERIIHSQFSDGEGQYQQQDMIQDYLDRFLQNISLKRKLRIVIDAGNGVTGFIAPLLFQRLGCEVHELFCDVDGAFPNHHPDPSDPHNLQDLIYAVREKKADVGLAFDGDGDRLGVVTSEGEIIWPDRLLMLFAEEVLTKQPGAKIIYDVKCTHHLQDHILARGGEPLMWKTGHSFIKAKLAETKAPLAGEMSGHFFFGDRWYGFDDALYAGARLLELISAQKEPSHYLLDAMPNSVNTAELKVLVNEAEKFNLMQQLIDCARFQEAKEVVSIDGLRINFHEGWGLIRPSNTTPYLILRFEALNEAVLFKIQNLFREWMLSVKPDFVLPF